MKYCTEKNFAIFLGAWFIALCCLTGSAFGGDHNHSVVVPDDILGIFTPDSLLVEVYDGMDSTATLYESFPVNDTVILDSTKPFTVRVWISYDAFDGYELWDEKYYPAIVVSASATVDYDSIFTRMDNEHGDGSYTASGDGAASVSFYTYSTAGDSTTPVAGVTVTAWNTAQTIQQGMGSTGSDSGKVDLNLAEADAVIVAALTGWTWPTYDTHTIVAGSTYSVYGTWYSPEAPGDSNLCRVWAYMKDQAGNLMKRKNVWFEIEGEAWNLCDSTVPYFQPLKVTTDTTGLFEVDLYYSTCWAEFGETVTDTVRYKATVEGQSKSHIFIVPDTSAYRLLWGVE